ncbi:MAG: ATP-binding protein [Candidatus Fermentibacteraceae bacterium]|nr:ATP-binding protein [Candidatus Fermentibacteraceae bacterium]
MREIEIRLPSELSVLEPLQVFVESIGKYAGVEEDELSSLSVSVVELVKNAMEHGNGNDPEKIVTVTIDTFQSRIRFFIDDEGTWEPDPAPGFDPGEGVELLSNRGRGVLIARNLARWVDFGLTPEGKTRVKLIWPLT